MNTELHG